MGMTSENSGCLKNVGVTCENGGHGGSSDILYNNFKGVVSPKH